MVNVVSVWKLKEEFQGEGVKCYEARGLTKPGAGLKRKEEDARKPLEDSWKISKQQQRPS